MRGVTATRAASSQKDEGKPSGKHANAPNNASNAWAQDARRGTFSRGFEPEPTSALVDGERRWARVLDHRGASGPADAGDDAGDGEGRSPAATAESAPSASRHTSAAIVEPAEEGADPAKKGGVDPSEGYPAGARIAAAPADFAPASTAISRSAAAATRDARPSATRAKSAARRTISIASDAGAEDEGAEDEDADPVPDDSVPVPDDSVPVPDDSVLVSDDSVLVPGDSHASLTPTTSAASAASAAARATFGSGSTTARAKTSTAVRHAGPNPRGHDVKHAPNPSTNLARVSASSARTNASRNGRAAASPAAAPAPVASALSNAARATRRIPSAAIDDADESGWPHASTNTRDAVDHTRVHTGRTRPTFAAETSISFASAYGRGETSARAASFPSEDASASAQRCTRATRASASTNTMASSVSSRVDAENTSFVAAIPSSLDNHAPNRLSAAFGATRAVVAPTATPLESETATSLESESSPLNVSSFAVRSGARTAEASRASSRACASESPRDRNASTRQMTSIAGAHRAPSASVSLAASSTSVRTASAPWVAIPSGLVPTPEASTRNVAKASRVASARKSAASRNVARAPSSGSAACAASSACANADATARNRGAPAVSSMGRARPGSDAEWKRASRAWREDNHSRTARSAASDSASRSRSRRSKALKALRGTREVTDEAFRADEDFLEDFLEAFEVDDDVSAPRAEDGIISSATTRAYRVANIRRSMVPPSSVLVAMAMKSSSDMRALPSIVGLCASVLSMITAKARTYAASGVAKTPGLHRQYRAANASITRSIFCASPGRRNGPPRNARSATSNSAPTKSCASTKARVVRAASADPKNSPAATGSTPREENSRRKDATADGSSASNTPARELARGLRLNREMAASTDAFAALAAPKRADSDARVVRHSRDDAASTSSDGSSSSPARCSWESESSPESSSESSPEDDARHVRNERTTARTHCTAPFRTCCASPLPATVAPANAATVRSYRFGASASQS